MLDKNGFTRPTYNEIVEQESDKWVQLFGENAQTTSRHKHVFRNNRLRHV